MDILLIIVIILLASFAYGSLRAAPWVPTRQTDIENFLKLADIKSGQKVYDIGCGDGRLVCVAAEKGAIAVGFEVSLIPFILAQVRRYRSVARKNIAIKLRDFWFVDFSDADLVYLFLMPKIFPKLEVKLKKQLKPGARVISYVWPITGLQEIDRMISEKGHTMYLYQI